MILNNLLSLRADIQKTCASCGRNPSSVKVVLVTKTLEVDVIREAYGHAMTVFGENKVQELLRKIDRMPSDCEWHLIGHLQSNKVKYVYDKVAMIHSLDSFRLAQEIDKFARRLNRKIKCLMQVNVANEDTKFGVSTEDVFPLVSKILDLKGIDLAGFMAIAPLTSDEGIIRSCFRQLRVIRDTCLVHYPHFSFSELSMGMSNDYKVAIEEGATLLRIGSLIFGERVYT